MQICTIATAVGPHALSSSLGPKLCGLLSASAELQTHLLKTVHLIAMGYIGVVLGSGTTGGTMAQARCHGS